jgi:uncharacterized RDD family membrane protein YckC
MEPIDQILDAPVDAERHLNFAGFWIRVAAYMIDLIIITIVNLIVNGISSGSMEGNLFTEALSLGLTILYFSLMESSEKQATFGKMAVGIRVGNFQGEKISFANALGRYFGKIVSTILLCIGFMMVGWDDRKQGIHDKLADTYVYYV